MEHYGGLWAVKEQVPPNNSMHRRRVAPPVHAERCAEEAPELIFLIAANEGRLRALLEEDESLAGLRERVDQAGVLRNLIPRDPEAADELVVELKEELRSAIGDIRRLVYDLRPPALDDLGLVAALERLAERYSAEDEGLRVTVEAPEELPPLPAAVEVAVYRIAQEALTNGVRHAGRGSA